MVLINDLHVVKNNSGNRTLSIYNLKIVCDVPYAPIRVVHLGCGTTGILEYCKKY